MKIYNKLVRDRIPEIIARDGKKPVTRTFDDKEYVDELVKKLGEEYEEFKTELSLEEFADIQEVVLTLANTLASQEELDKIRVKKAEECGGFESKVYLEVVE